ncbi:hypothetical protein HYN59_06405 [Flavobacterium album]|uniref:Uncharacterized protein n=1 Tax=Flavobacterium album TaxID=2175091 RepID=A0A2S1QWJ6_9FLAO|nr:hypothetical protein [Flavobacterium album]AWH84777.1 hypothetical protein HYN59_06405 [Flavobacterium album]
MDRQEFFIQLWRRYFRPALVIMISLFIIYLLYQTAKNITTFVGMISDIVLLMAALVTVYILKTFLEKQWNKVYARLSDRTQENINILSKVAVLIGDCILGIIIFQLWQRNWLYASALMVIVLIGIIREAKKDFKNKKRL